VRATTSSWQGKRIVTRVELDTTTGPIAFIVPGGSVDGVGMRVTGMPAFTVGEHARVQLQAGTGGYHFVGLERGKVLLP
jgi:hypothetical protein